MKVPLQEVRLKLAEAVLRGFLGLLNWLPKSFFPVLATIGLWLLRPFLKRERSQLFTNLEQIYNLPRHSSFARGFARQVFAHQLNAGLETLRAIHDPDAITLEGLADLTTTVRGVLAGGKGIVIVTAHLGSWELVGYAGAKASGQTFHVLAKPSKMKAATKVLDDVRSKMGTKVLWTDRKSLLRDMLTVLKAGGALGFVMDQKPAGRIGPRATFFERPTEFVSGPSQVALRTGAPIVAVFCVRVGPWRYKILSRVLYGANHQETDAAAMTETMASEMERVIRLYPEQWPWNYRRWRFDKT